MVTWPYGQVTVWKKEAMAKFLRAVHLIGKDDVLVPRDSFGDWDRSPIACATDVAVQTLKLDVLHIIHGLSIQPSVCQHITQTSTTELGSSNRPCSMAL